jgi:mannan endo-1,4-beta-mannosidase
MILRPGRLLRGAWPGASMVVLAAVILIAAERGSARTRPGNAPDSTDTAFVTRSGTSFVLGDQPFPFVGVNMFGAAWDASIYQCGPAMANPDAELDDWFGHAESDFGARVIRFWAFQSYTASATDWRALDRVVQLAGRHGLKVLPVLENQWADCTQGGDKNAAWYATGYQQPYGAYPLDYQEYVRRVVSRYRDEPAIFGWELMNEARSRTADGRPDPEALFAFARDMTSLVKSLDHNHLVTLGVSTGRSPGVWGWYGRLHGLETVDFLGFHDYGSDDVPLPGAPAQPMALLNTKFFTQDHNHGWQEEAERQNQPGVWETWSATLPPGPQPFQTAGIGLTGGAYAGDVYLADVRIGAHAYDFEDGSTQGWAPLAGPVKATNVSMATPTGQHALRVTLTAANGDDGLVMVHPPPDVGPGTPISARVYVDTPGAVDHAGTLAAALATANALAKPLVVDEAGMTTCAAWHGSAVHTPEARAAKFDHKLSAFFDAGGAGYLVWMWHPSNDCSYQFTPGDPLNAVLAKYGAKAEEYTSSSLMLPQLLGLPARNREQAWSTNSFGGSQ